MCIKLQLPSFVESTGLSIKKKKNLSKCFGIFCFPKYLAVHQNAFLQNLSPPLFFFLLEKLTQKTFLSTFIQTACMTTTGWYHFLEDTLPWASQLKFGRKKKKKEKKSQQKDWFGNSAYRKYTQKGDVLFSFHSMFS